MKIYDPKKGLGTIATVIVIITIPIWLWVFMIVIVVMALVDTVREWFGYVPPESDLHEVRHLPADKE